MSQRRFGQGTIGIARSAAVLFALLVGTPASPVLAQPHVAPAPEPAPRPARRNPEMMGAGIVITGLATIALATGIGGLLNSDRGGSVGMMLGITATPASFGLAAIGVPLWVAGALPKCSPQTGFESRAPISPALRNAGIVMTSVAATGLVMGTASWIAADRNHYQNKAMGIGGGVAVGTSLLVSSISVPLWVTGAHPSCASRWALAPEVSVGPTTTLRWTF